METDYLLVITTTSSKEEAEIIADLMVSKRLAACVQVEGPLTSVYWWKGKPEKDQEWKCSFKTSQLKYSQLEQAIKENHSYDTPEIIALPIVMGSTEYLDWMKTELEAE